MKSFDKVPVMDREYFEDCMKYARTFEVVIQITPYYQIFLDITKEQALKIANQGLDSGTAPIWGMFSNYSNKLTLSLSSQWLDTLKNV